MTSLRSKITGMFFGVAIGDALGKPVETFSKSKIDKTFGRITKYESSKYHKWFDGDEIGTITDDTQLTIAVAESIIESNGLNMDSIAKWHVDALSVTDAGWGNSTRLAVKNLQSGIIGAPATTYELIKLESVGDSGFRRAELACALQDFFGANESLVRWRELDFIRFEGTHEAAGGWIPLYRAYMFTSDRIKHGV
jgi:ADP-ribosylglycohydrolase